MFEEFLKTKPHNSHYLKRYIKFINHCISTNTDLGSNENHHICPKSKDLFPEFTSFKKYPWNKSTLTFRQHYIAHWLLWKTYGGSQTRAFKLMCHRGKSMSSEIYEKVRLEHNLMMKGDSNPNKNGSYAKISWRESPDSRRKKQSELMRDLNKLKKKPKETRHYKCTNCNADLEYIEFCHHSPKEYYYCNAKCRNAYVFKHRNKPIGNTKTKADGRTSWNKGLKNPTAADNARKGASKLSATVKGRTRLYKGDGSWTWQYPQK